MVIIIYNWVIRKFYVPSSKLVINSYIVNLEPCIVNTAYSCECA
uniref:Uncharacterized protein n=1 Tax=Anguilla anguilla TaxID=7936 RepID=A0A0E9UMM6_ANGAN